MKYLLNPENKTLTDAQTLQPYRLNDAAVAVLTQVTSGTADLTNTTTAELLTQLADLGIEPSSVIVRDPSKLHLHTPIVHIIQNCNSPCVMCDCWKTRGRVLHHAEDLAPLFAKFKRAGARAVMLSGGEPTMHLELEEIIRGAKSSGLMVELNTNGISLDKREYLPGLDLDAVVVSLDGFSRSSYRDVRGIDRFERVTKNLRDFKRQSPRTTLGLRVTLTKYSLDNLHELMRLVRECGIDNVGFSPLDVSSTSFFRDMTQERQRNLSDSLLPTLDDIARISSDLRDPHSNIYRAIEDGVSSGVFIWGLADFTKCIRHYEQVITRDRDGSTEPCAFPDFSLLVEYDGSVRPCFYGPRIVDFREFEPESWNLQEIRDDLIDSGSCVGCRGKVFCGQ